MNTLPPGVELMIDSYTVRVQGNRSALVESKTTADEWHAVEWDEEHECWACTCRGYEIRKACRHARAVGRFHAGTADVRFRDDSSASEA